jgi:hypothetical protein
MGALEGLKVGVATAVAPLHHAVHIHHHRFSFSGLVSPLDRRRRHTYSDDAGESRCPLKTKRGNLYFTLPEEGSFLNDSRLCTFLCDDQMPTVVSEARTFALEIVTKLTATSFCRSSVAGSACSTGQRCPTATDAF